MILKDLLAVLDTVAPLRWAEPWDNVGLLIGDPGAAIARALLTIDLTPAVLDEAVRERCELVIAYHPAIFDGLKRIRHQSVIHRAIRADIAVYCPHTALDVAPGGTNDMLCDAIGLADRAPLKLTVPAEGVGIGRAGTLAAPVSRTELIHRLKRALELDGVLVAGPIDGEVTRAAVCAGAGRSLLGDALALRTEIFITGEIPHHDALRAAAAGMTVVCALHSNSERATLRRLAARLSIDAPAVAYLISETDRDPFSLR